MAFSPDESSTGMAPTTAAGLASLLSVLGAFYFSIAEKRSKFVKLYVQQSLRIFILAFFGAVMLVAGTVLDLTGADMPAMLCKAAAAMLYLAWALCLLALTINAFGGKVLILPVFGAGLKKKLDLE